MLHSYPWYPADWRSSEAVLAMSCEERGIYRELLDHVWEQGSISNQEVVLIRVARATRAEFKRSWPRVKQCFYEQDGRLYHPKVNEKRQDLLDWHENRRQAGRKGGLSRASSSASSSAKADLKPSTPTPTPSSSTTSTTTSEVLQSSSISLNDKNGKPKIVTTTEGKYATEKDELVALMCETMGHSPETEVVRDVFDRLEIRGMPVREFLADIRPRIQRLKLPPGEGFFLSQARNGHEKVTMPETAAEKKARTGPCEKCKNTGFVEGEYCDCRMAKDLKRVAARKTETSQQQKEAS